MKVIYIVIILLFVVTMTSGGKIAPILSIGDARVKRSCIKGFITRTLNKLKDLQADAAQFATAKVHLRAIKNKLEEYKIVSEALLQMHLDEKNEPVFEKTYEETAEYEVEIEAKIEAISLVVDPPKEAPVPVEPPKPKPDGPDPSVMAYLRPSIKSAELPTFNGNYRNWLPFWQAFEASIHSQKYPNVLKFNHLMDLLGPDAKPCIEGIPVTNETYMEAIDTLRSEYHVPHKLVDAYMKDLTDLFVPSYTKADLQRFAYRLNTNIRMLRSVGKRENSYETLLVPILLKKLPKEVKTSIAKDYDGEVKLQNIQDTLKKEIRVLEIISSDDSSVNSENCNNDNTSAFNVQTRNNPNSHSGSKKPKGGRSPRDQHKPKSCSFCNKNHKSADCLLYKDPKSRFDRAKELNLCVLCLNDNHKASACNFRSKSVCKNCNMNNHNSLLCFKSVKQPIEEKSKTNTNLVNTGNNNDCNSNNGKTDDANSKSTQESQDSVVQNPNDVRPTVASICSSVESAIMIENSLSSRTYDSTCSNDVMLKTGCAEVRSASSSIFANLMMDDGSMRSWVNERVAKLLDLKVIDTEPLTLAVFGSETNRQRNFDVVELSIVTLRGELVKIFPLVIPVVSSAIHNNDRFDISRYKEFRSLTLANNSLSLAAFPIDLLIGSNHYDDIILEGKIKAGGLTATPSRIGYFISGPIGRLKHHTTCNTSAVMKALTDCQSLNETLKNMSSLESVGIESPKKSKEPEFDLQSYCQSLEFNNGVYTARLPWRNDCPFLPNNFNYSLNRTKNLVKKLVEKDLLNSYNDVINMQISRGFIEKVQEPIDFSSCHFISHFCVLKLNSSTPLRIVFDASAKSSKAYGSLNDCLYAGPALHNDMVGILLRSRVSKFLLVSDIEKAFNMIKLHELDRPYCMFLWLDNPSDPNSKLVPYAFNVILFGTSPSPFILNITVIHHLSKYLTQVSEDIRRNAFVDNVCLATDSDEYCTEFYSESRQMLTL